VTPQEQSQYLHDVMTQQDTIIALEGDLAYVKSLLGRAAEMLETLGCKGPAIAELRKAAQ